MAAQTFQLSANDGLTLAGYCWPCEQPKATLQIVHGMTEHAQRYAPFAQYLNQQGIQVYAHDLRGHGRSTSSQIPLGFFASDHGWEKAVADIAVLHQHIQQQHPQLKHALLGHSMGSFLAQHFLMSQPHAFSAVLLSGSKGPTGALLHIAQGVTQLEILRQGEYGQSQVLHNLSFFGFNHGLTPRRTEFDWLSRDTEVVDAYLADPLCGFRNSNRMWQDVYRGLQYIEQPQHRQVIPRDLPLYLFCGDKDPVGQQGKSVARLAKAYQKAGFKDLQLSIYPGGRHEMLNEINAEQVYSELSQWLQPRLGL